VHWRLARSIGQELAAALDLTATGAMAPKSGIPLRLRIMPLRRVRTFLLQQIWLRIRIPSKVNTAIISSRIRSPSIGGHRPSKPTLTACHPSKKWTHLVGRVHRQAKSNLHQQRYLLLHGWDVKTTDLIQSNLYCYFSYPKFFYTHPRVS